MITIHHLGLSQSERIIWLCEELGVPYKIVKHNRDPIIAPESLRNVPGNETGRSPFIEDSDAGITLGETGAIGDYIIYKYGGGRLALKPENSNFKDYLYWYHYANASQQSEMVMGMMLGLSDASPDHQMSQFSKVRLDAMLKHTDDRLKDNKWLAGPEFTAADIMNVYGLTTQRYFGPLLSLGPHKNILRWLQDCSQREAYQRAMQAGDPEMKPLLGADAPEKSFFDVGGVNSDHWKK